MQYMQWSARSRISRTHRCIPTNLAKDITKSLCEPREMSERLSRPGHIRNTTTTTASTMKPQSQPRISTIPNQAYPTRDKHTLCPNPCQSPELFSFKTFVPFVPNGSMHLRLQEEDKMETFSVCLKSFTLPYSRFRYACRSLNSRAFSSLLFS